jgi:hypothetical protein
MISYVVVSIVSGIVFGILDGLINANPLGRKLMEAYKPIAKKSINVAAGIIIDIAYGFILAGIFVVFYESLPGDTGIVKGISFGILAWFLRVTMSVISSWMMYTIPVKTLLYSLLAGLIEMLILGLIYGGFLKPWI